MTPSNAIDMLNRQLAKHGETVMLQRITNAAGGVSIKNNVQCRAFVRGYAPDELVGGIVQSDSRVILSATEIEREDWPGPNSSTTPTNQDRRVPRKGDNCLIQGRIRNIENAKPFYMNDQLVRIELQVKG
jgi:hypothetical protein